MIDIKFLCLCFVPGVQNTARNQQAVCPLPHEELSWIIRDIEAQNRVDASNFGRLKQEFQAARVVGVSCAGQQGRLAYNNTLITKSNSTRFCQPLHPIRRKRVERPQSANQNANDDNATEDSETPLFPHRLPSIVPLSSAKPRWKPPFRPALQSFDRLQEIFA
jgi:hypothetical protein